MKKNFIILSHCDTHEKKDILRLNINKIKQIPNSQIILTSHISLPEDIVNSVDYFLFDKSNPILYWPNRCFLFWKKIDFSGRKIKLTTVKSDYGWTPINQIQKGGGLALLLDCEENFFLNYDLNIDEEIISFIDSNAKTTIFPVSVPNTFFEVGLLFFKILKNDLKILIDSININIYKNFDITEKYFKNLFSNIEHDVSHKVTSDTIRFFRNDYDMFNNSKIEKINYFISDMETHENSFFRCIFFYNLEKNLKINIDNNKIIELEKNNQYMIDYIKSVEMIRDDGTHENILTKKENEFQFITAI